LELEAAKADLERFGGRVEILPADVSQPAEVDGLAAFALERFGTIDILVNCAGVYGRSG